MTSAIDPTKPTSPAAYTADVRANFAAAKSEIEALQASGGGGGGGGIPEAPNDGKAYGRQNGAWVPVLALSGQTLPTSPSGLSPGTLWNNGGVLCIA